MANQVTNVQIVSNTINTYSQIMRACISGMNACAKLHDAERRQKFEGMLLWATQEHALLTQAACDDAGNPALG